MSSTPIWPFPPLDQALKMAGFGDWSNHTQERVKPAELLFGVEDAPF